MKAVDDVSLEIDDGEFLVLVGPSGCGKSTLLRMIAGLEEVTDGEIWIGDRDVTDLAPRSRDIAMVFQTYALYPHMTVRQNLGYGLKARRTPKAEIARRVDDVAELLGLDDLLERRPAQLSGGQRQRVAMGRAIVREPQAFLLDEPLSNLDAKLRVGMRASLAQLHQRLDVTTVYVTHDQTEAMTLGQRVAVMRDGQILQIDTPQRALRAAAQPLHRGVHRLAGDESRRRDGRRRRRALRAVPRHAAGRPPPAVSGDRVVLGIRPESFEDAAFAPGRRRSRSASRWSRSWGPTRTSSSTSMRPRSPPKSWRQRPTAACCRPTGRSSPRASTRALRRVPGGALELAVDPARFHFFDPETGARLETRPPRPSCRPPRDEAARDA